MTLALLTGASRGIGRSTAEALARRGVTLALLGRRSPGLDATVQALADAGADATPFYCDLARASEIPPAAERVFDTLGVPDALINNAGVAQRAPVSDMSATQFDEHLAVNLRAPFLLSQAMLPGMLARGSGRIVHVGSISSTLGSATQSAYNASKWGLVGFMKSLAEELRDTGVVTVAVLPGSVDTEMLQGSSFAPRMTPEEVAATLVHFALDAPATAHNGSVIEMFGI